MRNAILLGCYNYKKEEFQVLQPVKQIFQRLCCPKRLMLDVKCQYHWRHSCNFNKHWEEVMKNTYTYMSSSWPNIGYMPSVPSTFDFLSSSALWTAIGGDCQVMDQKRSNPIKSLQKIHFHTLPSLLSSWVLL